MLRRVVRSAQLVNQLVGLLQRELHVLEVVWCFCLPDRVDQAIEKVGSLYDSPTFPCINTVPANDYPSSGGDCQPCIEKTDYPIPDELLISRAWSGVLVNSYDTLADRYRQIYSWIRCGMWAKLLVRYICKAHYPLNKLMLPIVKKYSPPVLTLPMPALYKSR